MSFLNDIAPPIAQFAARCSGVPMTPVPPKMADLQVLVLEDEPLLLLDVQDMLAELGVK
jgi:hypothetical protein